MHQNFLKYAVTQNSQHMLTNNNALKKQQKSLVLFRNPQIEAADVLTLVLNFCYSAELWIAVETKSMA